MAREPARIASGSVGQAPMSEAKAVSVGRFGGAGAPDFAPPWVESAVFAGVSVGFRIPPFRCLRTLGGGVPVGRGEPAALDEQVGQGGVLVGVQVLQASANCVA